MSKGDRRQDECPFCKLDPAQVLMSNTHAVAFRDAFPISNGHTLVVPKQHAESLFELHPEVQESLWSLVAVVRRRLVEDFRPDGFNVGFNDGQASGQTVRHAYTHVIPRYKDDVADPRGGVRWVIPAKAKYWK